MGVLDVKDMSLQGKKVLLKYNGIDMAVVDYPNMVYVGEEHGNARGYTPDTEAKKKGIKVQKLSGTEFRKRLRSGDENPEWFAFPSVVKTLREGGDAIFL